MDCYGDAISLFYISDKINKLLKNYLYKRTRPSDGVRSLEGNRPLLTYLSVASSIHPNAAGLEGNNYNAYYAIQLPALEERQEKNN